MPLTSDLMGLGLAPAVASLLGDSIPAAVAGVGTAQSGAPTLTGVVNQVTTSAGQTAVVLSSNQPVGTWITVYVSTATAALVFPPTGGNINEGAANAPFSVAQAKPCEFYRLSTTKWIASLSA